MPGSGGSPRACIAMIVAIGSLGSNGSPEGTGIPAMLGKVDGNGGDPACGNG